ncbi:hypothetical protein DFH07DRAFT_881387 [Mycena maculata]|uniref:FAD-binding domain-containing protein n=1 Tax=Mycena maculata TaxID=230809 RepID=A0AAD7JJW9_9AGAR|nr:hypothetical protein DFH07DRAFT_881387 [Mycena maculata]
MSTEKPSVAIIGAGVGGLSVAAVLHKAGFNQATVTVYERDPDRDARAHLGSCLDLHTESGIAAMKAAGLEKEFRAASRPEGEAMIITNKTGVPLWEETGKEGSSGRPEIDRTVLRNILLDALPADTVKWDHHLVSITPAENGTHHLEFSNGFKTTCTLLVGADGARSKVRPLLSSAVPTYAGVTGAEISLAPGSAPDLAEKVGKGGRMALDDGKSLLSQYNGDGRVRTYAWFKHPTPDAFGVPEGAPFDPEDVLRRLEARYADWAPPLRGLIGAADRSAVYLRPLFLLPPEHDWAHRKGVTLLGDAANLMSPFAGEGANTAMRSGKELAEALVWAKTVEQWDFNVQRYERDRFRYASGHAKESAKNLEMAYQDDAAEQFVAFFKQFSTLSGQIWYMLGEARKRIFGV